MLTYKCASRHSGVQFFDIWTSKSAPRPSVFLNFDLKMCFSPQRRAIFRHLNVKKWSEPDMFCTFLLENALLATAACNFSTSQLQKMVWACQFFSIFTSKCASRYSGVQFFNISTAKSGPELMCFVHFDFRKKLLLATAACNFWCLLWPHDSAPAALTSLLFDSPDTRIIGKTQRFATSLTVGAGELLSSDFRAIASSFFWLYFIFWLYFLLTLLHLSAFHLLFNSPYCRKFTI